MLSQGKQRLQDLGYVVPYIDFPLLDDITQKRRFYEICEELDIPFPKPGTSTAATALTSFPSASSPTR